MTVRPSRAGAEGYIGLAGTVGGMSPGGQPKNNEMQEGAAEPAGCGDRFARVMIHHGIA